jgi:DNA adenine methylase
MPIPQYKKSKTPFPRIGGKFYMSKLLLDFFPDDIDYYVEPFVGSGVVYFSYCDKTYSLPSTVILNDIDSKIYLSLKELKNNPYVNSQIKRFINPGDFELLKNSQNPLDIITCFKFSWLGKGISYSCNQNTKNKHFSTDFEPFHIKLSNALLSNTDYKNVISEHNHEHAFFYLDPPYEGSTKNIYHFPFVKPIDIYDAVKQIKGRFILSYNDSPYIRDLFKEYHIYELPKIYKSTGKTTHIIELVITNFVTGPSAPGGRSPPL